MSMWGGGVRPPKPPSVAPPPPAKTSYSTQRQKDELEALRQRGLAKLLNRHFTSVTKTIAQERAEAERALRDLETRKANTSEFRSKPGERSIWDEQMAEIQQRRARVKKKERETLLLYQRYVDKFGGTGAVSAPTKSDVKMERRGSGTASAVTAATAARRQSDVKATPTTPKATYEKSWKLNEVSPNVPVPIRANDIETNLDKHVTEGGERHPSIKELGVESTYKDLNVSNETQSKALAMRILEGKGVDYKASPLPTKTTTSARAEAMGVAILPDATATTVDPKTASSSSSKSIQNALTSPESSTTNPALTPSLDDDESEDAKSNVSGLTSTNSFIMSDAENRLLDYLKSETDAIRLMMDEEETQTSYSHKSAKSGFSNSMIGESSARAATKAEQMVRKMQEMIADFESNKIQGMDDDDDNDDATERDNLSHDPYRLETKNPDERWMVLWDPNHQRQYYHEEVTGKVQWEKPDTGAIPGETTRVADFTRKKNRDVLSHYDVMPGQERRSSGGVSRRELYRLKRQRRRNRRRLAIATLFVIVVSGTYYGYRVYPSFTKQVDDVVDVSYQTVESVLGQETTERASRAVTDSMDVVHSSLPTDVAKWFGPTKAQRSAAEKEALLKQQQAEAAQKEAERREEQAKREALKRQQEAEAARKEAERREGEARKEALRREAEAEAARKEAERIKQKAHLEALRREQEAEAARKEAARIHEEERRKAEAERKRQEAERKRLEAERKRQEEEERKRKLEEERKRLEEEERKRQEAERKRLEEERKRKLEEEAERKRLEEERKRQAEEAERKRLEEERKQEAERKRLEEERLEREQREIEASKPRPWHCNVPLIYVVNKKCRELSGTKPIFDLKQLTDAMMQ